MKGHMQDGKFHPHTDYKKGVRKSRDQKAKTQGVIIRKAKEKGKLSTSLGAILSPKKRPPAVLLQEIKDDLDFRAELIDTNKEIKAEIKADPKSEFTLSDREEFKENAKEIQQIAKDIKRAFRDLPKEERQDIPREIKNKLRLLR